jgi:two-component system nitrogen regulation response regulator GlnG
MRAVVAQVAAYADGDAPVLICGEHGTGRELVARVLHQKGPRTGGRFVAVRPTFEDAPGRIATDDACERARRALRSASGGTLLVKDLSDLSRPSQKTLKRAIDLRKIAQAEPMDVHVVATSDLDIERAVDADIVSRDFYTLFEPRRIEVPRLRDRLDDLATLFERWVKHYALEIGRAKPSVSTRAIDRLKTYPWPGNVGELKSIARRLVVRVGKAKIEAGDVDEVLPTVASRVPLEDLAFEEMVKSKLAGLLARIDGYPVHDLYDKVLARVERPLFDLVLAHTGGNQLKAAEILGLNRNTLRKKLAELGYAQKPQKSAMKSPMKSPIKSALSAKKPKRREDRALDGD